MLIILFSIFCIHLVALATPGPDFFFVSQVAASQSRGNAIKSVLGITVGCVIWASVALLGLNAVIQKMAWLQRGIMILGGLYLCYLGYLLLQSAFKKKVENNPAEPNMEFKRRGFFIKGVLTNLANPKALVYFASIFSMIVTDDMASSTKWAILFLITSETLLWFLIVSALFSLPVVKRKYQQFTKWIDGIAGAIFGTFGIALVYRGGFGGI